MTRTAPSLLPALCLSLLAGCSGPSSDSLPARPTSNVPLIGASSEATQTARAGQPLSLEVSARDPQGSALSFSWSATTGTLGTASSDASSSHVTWTAPSCALAGPLPTITVTVTNASQLTASQSFTVSGLFTCSSWSQVSPPNAAHLNTRSALLSDGRVLVLSNAYRPGVDDAEVYDPVTDHWSHAGPPGEKHSAYTATSLPDGTVLVTGGTDDVNPVIYDPATNTWHSTGTMAFARSFGQTATLLSNGKVLVVGGGFEGPDSEGIDHYQSTETAELYDPSTKTWTTTGSLSQARFDHQATLLPDGKVLVIAGALPDYAQSLQPSELYDPATGTWSKVGAMSSNRTRHTATRLLDGKVLVEGGVFGAQPLSPSRDEAYDPATGTWSEVGTPIEGRSNHTATLLANGQVLVTGGICEINCEDSAKLYDPATSTWTPIAPMSSHRLSHTAIRLLTGQVLVVGGDSRILPAELYTP